MANAAGGKGERGEKAPRSRGAPACACSTPCPMRASSTSRPLARPRSRTWPMPSASASGAASDFPFATRAEFVAAIEAGGVAAMEVLARDLKALGLYAARSLSYEGVEYELVEHELTPEQVRIYDAYADAFQVIHNNLDAALEAANVTGERAARSTRRPSRRPRSAFEAHKQRFFNHLHHRDEDADADPRDRARPRGRARRRRADRLHRRGADGAHGWPRSRTEEWGDVQVDITPREYVLDYLAHAFPTQLFEPFTDGEGNLSSRPVYRDGQPVQCREAVERRDRLIEHLAALAPVPGALDQIVQRFGTDMVAEVTGRSRRIVRKSAPTARLCVESRAGSANLAEAQAFMDDEKRILVFSDAGGTGRSYHADLGARNQRLRVHYLLEAGWRADAAIQGLGRTQPHQPGAAAAVPADRHRRRRPRSGSSPRSPAGSTRWAPSPGASARPAARACSGPRTISKAPMRGRPCASSMLLLFAGKVEGCSLTALRGGDRPAPHRPGRHLARGPAADHARSSIGCWR